MALGLGLLVGVMVSISYWRSAATDPGLTTEIALVLCCLLGALTMQKPALAAGLGVTLAAVLAFKNSLHQFVKHVLTLQELHDLIVLAATALIVLPLVPNQAFGPYQALNPYPLAQFVLMVMGLSAAGHVARRALGAQRGVAVTGLVGGFVSSTVT